MGFMLWYPFSMHDIGGGLMKKGILITNGFVGEESFKSLFRSLMEAAEKENIAIEQRGNDGLLFDIGSGRPLFDIDRYCFGIFWDKDIMLGQMLEKCGLRLFNSAEAVALCDDKALTHAALSGRLPMPKTIPVPQTYKYVGYGDMGFLKRAAGYLGLPMVIKECRGSFGKQVYLAQSEEQAAEIIRSHEATPMIMQRAVTESFGRDIRIYVVGGEVMGAMQRSNGRDFRANIANGGSAEAYSPSGEEKRLALEAVRLLGLDFGGVDILHSKDGPLLCEVNSNAHFAGMEKSTGADISGAIMRHIKRELEK